jgi:hypothetical protein
VFGGNEVVIVGIVVVVVVVVLGIVVVVVVVVLGIVVVVVVVDAVDAPTSPPIPITVTGWYESAISPFPNSPLELPPQHFTDPFERSAQVEYEFASRATTPESPATTSGM